MFIEIDLKISDAGYDDDSESEGTGPETNR